MTCKSITARLVARSVQCIHIILQSELNIKQRGHGGTVVTQLLPPLRSEFESWPDLNGKAGSWVTVGWQFTVQNLDHLYALVSFRNGHQPKATKYASGPTSLRTSWPCWPVK